MSTRESNAIARPGDREMVITRVFDEYGAIEGGKQTLARLAEHLVAKGLASKEVAA
jgi:hypothetical protein